MIRTLSIFAFMALLFTAAIASAETQGTVEVAFDLNAADNVSTARLWMPYPVSDRNQTIREMSLKGNYSNSAIYMEPESEALYIYAEWNGKNKKRSLDMTFEVTGTEVKHTALSDNGAPVPASAQRFLEPNHWIPTDGKVAIMAKEITRGKKGILQKSRAVYEWVVANTQRDPTINGCGLGDVEVTLAKRSGKCADISSVYVALARASGVPARDVFGFRVGSKKKKDITKSFHCWAEFYLPGTGWVPVDPADVRKLMLKKKLDLKAARPYIDYYFGSLDSDHIALSRSERGITFIPAQAGGPLSYFMYPYAEVDGKALDYFDPKAFGYKLSFKAR